MKRRYLAYLVPQLLFAVAVLGIVSPAAIAQQMQQCQGVKEPCVEVLLRYYERAPAKSSTFPNSKVQIVDRQNGQPLKACRICDPKVDPTCASPCPQLQGKSVYDASNLILLQTEHMSPGCFYMCSGGWCGYRCY